MSDREIRKLYDNVINNKKHKSPIREHDLYKLVVEDSQMELVPMRGEEESRITKAEIKRQAKEYKTKNNDKRSITAIAQAMAQGELPIAPPQQQQPDPRERKKINDNDIKSFNDLISVSDQIKIKNLLDSASKKALQKLLSGYATKKNINQVMSMIMYADIDVADFMEMISTSQADSNIQLLNADFLLTARPGVYSINDFVIPDGTRDSTGVARNYRELTVQSLEALKNLGAGGTQAGPYESAFQLLSNGNISQKGKGDIAVGNQLMELKAENGRVGPEEYPSRKDVVTAAVDSFSKAIDTYLKDFNADVLKQAKKQATDQLKYKGTSYDVLSEMISTTFGDYQTPEVRYTVIQPIVKKLYPGASDSQINTIAETFAGNYDDFRPVIAGVLFDIYKNEKSGTDGAWNRLIGINLESADAICIFENGDQFADAVRKSHISSNIPNVIATGTAAARDYMWQLLVNDIV